MIRALLVFAAVAILDFVWARYTFAMTARRSFGAALYASVLILLSGSAAVGYTQNHWLLIPAAAGAFIGTLVAVEMQKTETT
jgi:general stress protein CsbA